MYMYERKTVKRERGQQGREGSKGERESGDGEAMMRDREVKENVHVHTK